MSMTTFRSEVREESIDLFTRLFPFHWGKGLGVRFLAATATLENQGARVFGDHQVFVGLDDAYRAASATRADLVRVRGVEGGVQGDAEVGEAIAYFGADCGGAFADAAGEYQ